MTIKECWEEYLDEIKRIGVSPLYIESLKLSFYAGASAVCRFHQATVVEELKVMAEDTVRRQQEKKKMNATAPGAVERHQA